MLVLFLLYSSFRSGQFNDPVSWLMSTLMTIPGIVIGLAFHEYAHALAAYKLGDPTPKMQGRVTVNPLVHIDPLGFIALIFAGFGWGVPVQINPSNFRHRRRDEFMVSIAGVAMNLLIAVVFALIAKALIMFLGESFISTSPLGDALWKIIINVILINLVLMIFNLIPCPPLDGFSIISEIFNIKHTEAYWTLYRYGDWILIGLIIFGITGKIISPCVNFLFNMLWTYIIF